MQPVRLVYNSVCMGRNCDGFLQSGGYSHREIQRKNRIAEGEKTANDKVKICMGCLTCMAACPQDVISVKRSFRPRYRLTKICQVPEMTYPRRY